MGLPIFIALALHRMHLQSECPGKEESTIVIDFIGLGRYYTILNLMSLRLTFGF